MSAGRPSKYAQVAASVRAMRSKMLGRSGYDRLFTCSTVSECMSTLRESGYFEGSTAAGEQADSIVLKGLLDKKMSALLQKLVRLSPADCAELLSEFERTNRLELFKLALKLMASRGEDETLPSMTFSDFEGSVRGLVEARNVERLLELAGAPVLHEQVSSALAENKALPLIEAIVDRHSLFRLWKAAEMSDWVDRQTARLLVGERIDAANLLLVIRSKTLGISAEEIQSAVVPVNYRLGETLHAAAAAGSALNALRAFVKTAYSDCVEGFLESYKDGNSLQHLDLALRRRHASTCLTLFAGFPFSAGLPIAFAYLMGYEMTDLQAIVSGKHDRVPRERIEQLLVL